MTDITANVVVSMPSQLFTMARSFKAVANGKIYIGKIDTDPVNPENRIPVYVENEDGSHVPVSQPIIINAAGYPVYNGQIAKFVTVQGHSMAVYDAYGVQQFYFQNVLKYDPDQLRAQLLSPLDGLGDSLVNVKQPGMSSDTRTVHDKMLESISIADYLTGDDVAEAITKALAATTGTIVVPAGDYTANPTLANVPDVLKFLSRANFLGKLTINLPAGAVNLSEKTIIRSQNVHNLSIAGVKHSTTIAGLVGVTGSKKSYLVTVSLNDTSNVSVGDVVMIRHDITGTGGYHIHCGGWVVTAVSGNNVTVKNTCHLSEFPTSTITGGSVVILKSILKYAGCDGIIAAGAGCIKSIDGVAIVGDYDLASGTGTIGAHGFSLTTPDITVDITDPSNVVFDASGCIAIGPDLAIVGFGEQGFVASERSGVVSNFISSCSNRKRGVYAEGAHIRGKFMLCSGNGEDGIISDIGGAIQANGSVCSGNGLNGFWSFNNSELSAPSGVACGNSTNGIEARSLSKVNFENGRSYLNVRNGVSASYGGNIAFTGGTSSDNVIDGIYSVYNATVAATNASSKNNGRYGVNCTDSMIVMTGSGDVSGNVAANYIDNGGGVIIDTEGGVIPVNAHPQRNLMLRNATTLSGCDISPSSIGDITISLKSSPSADLSGRYVFKADGTQHPSGDATQNLGRASNRYNVGYFAGGTQSSSDARLKTAVRGMTSDEINAAMKIAEVLGFWSWIDDESKRLHAGTTVQKVIAILEENNLDWKKYGFIGYDAWDDEFEYVTEIDEFGNLVKNGEMKLIRAAGDLWQFRDQELDRFIMRGLFERIRKLEESLYQR
ncbi:phage tailspike protein [Escherichia coli]|uniref:phage tailspike protein n=1 Tax=Escherichia coli TaxID=562 RepID=UPI0026525EC9|nr:phage tailspike protein [Escherichia coli]MDN7369809.1 phage tailspike protein [Escherichia coli]